VTDATDLGRRAEAVRRGAGLFPLADRGVIEVMGADRTRWLDGMLTNQVTGLAAASGCPALLLTRQGRIIAFLHVLVFADRFWLETARDAMAPAIAALKKLVIADDVTLLDASPRLARLALEGPAADRVLAAAGGQPVALEPDHFAELELGGAAAVAAGFGFTGERAFQLLAPAESAEPVAAALRAAGAELGLVQGDAELLELLRIEAGTPRFGAEIDESVLPDEARLGHAVSATKGCYIGQEVVARVRSRERLNHLLVGLALPGGALPEPGAELRVEGRGVGEVTSAVVSPRLGPIALGYLRVVELPFPGAGVAGAGLGPGGASP
jgi:folate-binding protein YgfZ